MFNSKAKANYKHKLIMRAVGSLEKLNADLALMPFSSLAF
jgi:hypothetical protein